MKLSDRIKKLEDAWFTDKESQPAAVIIKMLSARKDAGEPLPITKFSFQGQEIHRNEGESYLDFENRSTEEARKYLTHKYAVPVLMADGSMED